MMVLLRTSSQDSQECQQNAQQRFTPVGHGAQDGAAVLAAGGLPVVPPRQRRRVQPVVVLRDELLRQLGGVTVEVLALQRYRVVGVTRGQRDCRMSCSASLAASRCKSLPCSGRQQGA